MVEEAIFCTLYGTLQLSINRVHFFKRFKITALEYTKTSQISKNRNPKVIVSVTETILGSKYELLKIIVVKVVTTNYNTN